VELRLLAWTDRSEASHLPRLIVCPGWDSTTRLGFFLPKKRRPIACRAIDSDSGEAPDLQMKAPAECAWRR